MIFCTNKIDRIGEYIRLREVISFIVGIVTGINIICVIQVIKSDPFKDEEQMKSLKEWNEKHK